MRRAGFTYIELIMVIVLIGILAAVAIPKYVNLVNEAKIASEKGVVAAVRAALAIYFAEDLAKGGNGMYPYDLEDVSLGAGADQADDTILFQGVLQDPITDEDGWSETSPNVYSGSAATSYTYTPTDGKFKK